jgi:hypothetical protein
MSNRADELPDCEFLEYALFKLKLLSDPDQLGPKLNQLGYRLAYIKFFNPSICLDECNNPGNYLDECNNPGNYLDGYKIENISTIEENPIDGILWECPESTISVTFSKGSRRIVQYFQRKTIFQYLKS